jgi:SAM-dependent methyltransferase
VRAVTTDPLIEGVYSHRLPDAARAVVDDVEAPDEARSGAAAALATCERIGRRVEAERDRLIALLRTDGREVGVEGRTGPRQDHTIRLTVSDVLAADRAAATLEADGFERWERWSGGAAESFRRTAGQMTLGRTDDVTTVVRLRWAEPRDRNRFDRVFRPTSGDWDMVGLPPWAWWGYPLVRPVRLLAERAGLRRRHESGLGPYLSTPDGLIDPLLAFAGVGEGDLLMDVGCGDGRLVTGAAARFGCRAVGIERSQELVDLARDRVRTLQLTERVRIDHADARTVDLDDVTVLLMFLPVVIAADLLTDSLQRLPAGARLVIHEQSRPPSGLLTDGVESELLLGPDAVTVAHRWTVREPSSGSRSRVRR